MIFLWYGIDIVLMITIPLASARLIYARRQPNWGLFGVGAATFVLSQVGHIPFNWLVLQKAHLVPTDTAVLRNLVVLSIFLGLSAGLFEEGARFLAFRFWAKEARSWGKGLMVGIGHGGIESILVGFLTLLNVGVLATMRDGALLNRLTAEQLPLVQAQIDAIFSAPWHLILMGAMERLFAVVFHLSATLLVLQSLIRKQSRWLAAAVLWHGLLDATAVFAINTWNVYVTEALIGGLALVSAGIIFWLRAPEPVDVQLEPLPEIGGLPPAELELTADVLERSRYS